MSSAISMRVESDGAYLYRANLASAYLQSASLSTPNLESAILLNTNLGNARDLSPSQFNGASPPLLCATTLPADIALDPNRDCGQLPQALVNHYPGSFETVEAAAEFVQQQVPSAEM